MAAQELRDAHSKEIATQAALVSGVCISAAAYAVHEVVGREPGLSLLLAVGAMTAWGVGFAAGAAGSHAKQAAISANIAVLEANRLGKADIEERAIDHFNKQSDRAGMAYVAQLWCILIGAILFIASQMLYVYRPVTVDQLSNQRRCLAIQGEMLSARPRRSDTPALFQALGCHPQGKGSVHVPISKAPFSLSETKGQH